MVKLNPKMIVFACRDQTRSLNAIEKLRVATGLGAENVEFIPCDLDDLDSVKKFAEEFNSKYDKLDILLNNAGITALPQRQTTKQGLEKQFGVNHVGHFLLTTLLMDKIKASEQGRIINVSSGAHANGNFDFDDLHWEKNQYNSFKAYGQSKLSNVYFTRHMNTILEKEGVQNVKVCSLHPGVVRTELGRYMLEGNPCGMRTCMCLTCCCYMTFSKSPLQGAQTNLHCCLVDFEMLESGAYYADCKVKKERMPNDNWAQEAQTLWEKSEDMIKDYK